MNAYQIALLIVSIIALFPLGLLIVSLIQKLAHFRTTRFSQVWAHNALFIFMRRRFNRILCWALLSVHLLLAGSVFFLNADIFTALGGRNLKNISDGVYTFYLNEPHNNVDYIAAISIRNSAMHVTKVSFDNKTVSSSYYKSFSNVGDHVVVTFRGSLYNLNVTNRHANTPLIDEKIRLNGLNLAWGIVVIMVYLLTFPSYILLLKYRDMAVESPCISSKKIKKIRLDQLTLDCTNVYEEQQAILDYQNLSAQIADQEQKLLDIAYKIDHCGNNYEIFNFLIKEQQEQTDKMNWLKERIAAVENSSAIRSLRKKLLDKAKPVEDKIEKQPSKPLDKPDRNPTVDLRDEDEVEPLTAESLGVNPENLPVYPEQQVQPSMRWFKFLINFSLFFGAFSTLVYGIQFITGIIYSVQSNGQITSELIYSMFNGIQIVDILYGILMLGLAGFGIYTRFQLAKYKVSGPLCLYICFGAGLGINLLYDIIFMAITGVNVLNQARIASIIGSIIGSVVFVVLNYIYFNKRKMLFVR